MLSLTQDFKRLEDGYVLEEAIDLPNPFRTDLLRSGDHVPIRTYEAGNSRNPCVIIAPPLGVPVPAISPLTDLLSRHFYVVSWDTRGYPSVNDNFDTTDCGIERHAKDLLEVADHYGVSMAHMIGYCGGAAVAVRAAMERDGLCAKFVSICGSFNLSSVAGDSTFSKQGPELFRRISTNRDEAKKVGALMKKTLASGEYDGMYEGVADLKRFKDYIHLMYSTVETTYRYGKIQTEFCKENVLNWLPEFENESLLIAVEDDNVVPESWARYLADRWPIARLLVLDRGGHWAISKSDSSLPGNILNFLTATPSQRSP